MYKETLLKISYPALVLLTTTHLTIYTIFSQNLISWHVPFKKNQRESEKESWLGHKDKDIERGEVEEWERNV